MKNGKVDKSMDEVDVIVKNNDVLDQVFSKKSLNVNNKIEIDSLINPTKKFVKAMFINEDNLEKDELLLSFSFDEGEEVTTIKSDVVADFNLVEDALSKEFDVYFEQSKEKLNELKVEQDEIIKDIAFVFDSKELEEESILLDDLLEKLESMRKQFQILSESLNFDEIYRLGNTYFDDLVNKYASILDNDIIIRKQMDTIRNSSIYLEIVKSIKEMEEDNFNISLMCKMKKDESLNREKDFYLTSNKIQEIDDISKSITAFLEEEEKIIRDLDWKIKNAVSTYEQVQYIVDGNNRALRNLIVAVAASNFIGNKGLKTAFLVSETFRFMNAIMSVNFKEEKSMKLEVIDYSLEIEQALSDVDGVRRQLVDAKKQINDIFDYFNKNFREYADVIPEYKEVLVKMQFVMDVIIEQSELVELSNKDLENQHKVNYEKVKLKEDY